MLFRHAPIETYKKETKVGKLWPSFLQNQGTATATSSNLRSFLPKTAKIASDRGKQVSAHRRWAGAKIAFLNEYQGPARDLVVCLIVPGKLLLPQIFDRSLRLFVLLLALRVAIFFFRWLLEQPDTVVTRAHAPSLTPLTKQSMHCSCAYACLHAEQFVHQTLASVRLSDSFMTLDSCVEDGFFFF